MKLEENVYNEFNSIINNIPEGLTPIEKVRWVYIKLGDLFCYDYYLNYNEPVDFSSNYINRYQTCVQISEILNYALNKIGDGVKSEIYTRHLTRRGIYDQRHLANLVSLPSGEKYILDLTLDLFLIQGGFQTEEFGYSSNAEGNVDIFTKGDCEEVDTKLGLIKNGEYNDNKMRQMSYDVHESYKKDLDFETQMEYVMHKIMSVLPHYRSLQEARNCVNRCINICVRGHIFEYNLRNENEMVTCYCFKNNLEEEVWFLFNHKNGFVRTSSEEVFEMLSNGWYTKSNTLNEMLSEKQHKIKM